MIFVIENNWQYQKPAHNKYTYSLPFLEASNIYKILYLLDLEQLELLSRIIFISEYEDIQLYQEGFKKYSADCRGNVKEREAYIQIFDDLPKVHQLADKAKLSYINNLIANATILIAKDLSVSNIAKYLDADDHYVIYLTSSIKHCSSELIAILPEHNLNIFTNGKHGKYSDADKVFFFTAQEYINTNSLLKQLRNTIEKEEIDPFELVDLRPRDILDMFENEFSRKLSQLLADKRKRIKIFGNEQYIAKKTIDKLTSGKDKYDYYMPQDLQKIENLNTSMAIHNLETIDSPKDFKTIHTTIKTFSESYFVILQALYELKVSFFDHYDLLKTPDIKDVRDKITGILLYLLFERNICQEKSWKLYTLVAGNKLLPLVPKFNSLGDLAEALDNFCDVDYQDIISNVPFWLILKHALANICNSDKIKPVAAIKPKVKFEHRETNWIITINNKEKTFNYSSNIGLLYIAIIMKSPRVLNSAQVRMIANYVQTKTKLSPADKGGRSWKNEEDFVKSNRKTISSAIVTLKKKCPQDLQDFIKNHIKFSENDNRLQTYDRIEAVVIDPDIKLDYYESV